MIYREVSKFDFTFGGLKSPIGTSPKTGADFWFFRSKGWHFFELTLGRLGLFWGRTLNSKNEPYSGGWEKGLYVLFFQAFLALYAKNGKTVSMFDTFAAFTQWLGGRSPNKDY